MSGIAINNNKNDALQDQALQKDAEPSALPLSSASDNNLDENSDHSAASSAAGPVSSDKAPEKEVDVPVIDALESEEKETEKNSTPSSTTTDGRLSNGVSPQPTPGFVEPPSYTEFTLPHCATPTPPAYGTSFGPPARLTRSLLAPPSTFDVPVPGQQSHPVPSFHAPPPLYCGLRRHNNGLQNLPFDYACAPQAFAPWPPGALQTPWAGHYPPSGGVSHGGGVLSDVELNHTLPTNYYCHLPDERESGVLGGETRHQTTRGADLPPVLGEPAPPPSAAVTASHQQEALWKLLCLSVTCAPLLSPCDAPRTEDADTHHEVSSDERSKKRLKAEGNSQCSESCKNSDEGAFENGQWDGVVWRWLKALGMSDGVDEILGPGTKRVLVRWSTIEAAERWRTMAEASHFLTSRQMVFENVLLKWS